MTARVLVRGFYSKGFEGNLDDALMQITEFALGKIVYPSGGEHPADYVDVGERKGRFAVRKGAGKLVRPFPALQRDIKAILEPLQSFVRPIQARSLDIVVIFDGLDRLPPPDKFWAVVDQDLRALRQMRVGVIAAAPQSVLYGQGRAVSEHFDRVHQIRALSEPEIDFLARDYSHLKSVMIQRGATDLLGQDVVEVICELSGGVLRDLITLARDAGEAAYIEGAEEIQLLHANTAIQQMGESYLRGLGPEQIGILSRLKQERSFDVAASPNIELLVTGRVLEYSATDFRVHPALERLLAEPESK